MTPLIPTAAQLEQAKAFSDAAHLAVTQHRQSRIATTTAATSSTNTTHQKLFALKSGKSASVIDTISATGAAQASLGLAKGEVTKAPFKYQVPSAVGMSAIKWHMTGNSSSSSLKASDALTRTHHATATASKAAARTDSHLIPVAAHQRLMSPALPQLKSSATARVTEPIALTANSTQGKVTRSVGMFRSKHVRHIFTSVDTIEPQGLSADATPKVAIKYQMPQQAAVDIMPGDTGSQPMASQVATDAVPDSGLITSQHAISQPISATVEHKARGRGLMRRCSSKAVKKVKGGLKRHLFLCAAPKVLE